MEELIPKYKIGDVVQLVSGSPDLSISKILLDFNTTTLNNEFRGYYTCNMYDTLINDFKVIKRLHEDELILIKKTNLIS